MTLADWQKNFSEKLITIMKQVNINQSRLADKTGLSRKSISNMIHMRTIPTIFAVINIAYVLDVRVSELIDFGEPIT